MAPQRAHDDLESLFDHEDSDARRFELLVPRKSLQSLRPKAGTSAVKPNVVHPKLAWHQQEQTLGSIWYTDGRLLEA